MVVSLEYSYKADGDNMFGCAKLAVAQSAKPTNNKIHIVFSIDHSGSMSDEGRDGRTKLEHAKHTLINSINFVASCYKNNEEPLTVLVSVLAFDHDISELGLYINILNPSERNHLIQEIKALEPRGCTNIERILSKVRGGLATTEEIYGEEMRRVHIFMTDGHATEGLDTPEELGHLVDTSYTNIFIGYGTDHHYKLLKTLGNLERADNYFAESYERAGMVYGEILHNVLFSYPVEIKLQIREPGKIYDARNNKWVTQFILHNIAYGDSKTYNLRADIERTPLIGVTIGENTSKVTLDWGIHMNPEDPECPHELTLHGLKEAGLRQRILEYLAGCLASNVKTSREELRVKGKSLLEELKAMSEMDEWKGNALLRQLQDDVYVGLRSVDCDNGAMYVGARLLSLGSQRGYNVCDLHGMTPRHSVSPAGECVFGGVLPKRRGPSHLSGRTYKADEDDSVVNPDHDLPSHEMSLDPNSCFASPAAVMAMKTCSGEKLHKD
jgi:hypothetical protein